MVERLAQRLLSRDDQRCASARRDDPWSGPDEFRLAHEHRQHYAAPTSTSSEVMLTRRACPADALGVDTDAAEQRGAQPLNTCVPPSGVGTVLM